MNRFLTLAVRFSFSALNVSSPARPPALLPCVSSLYCTTIQFIHTHVYHRPDFFLHAPHMRWVTPVALIWRLLQMGMPIIARRPAVSFTERFSLSVVQVWSMALPPWAMIVEKDDDLNIRRRVSSAKKFHQSEIAGKKGKRWGTSASIPTDMRTEWEEIDFELACTIPYMNDVLDSEG